MVDVCRKRGRKRVQQSVVLQKEQENDCTSSSEDLSDKDEDYDICQKRIRRSASVEEEDMLQEEEQDDRFSSSEDLCDEDDDEDALCSDDFSTSISETPDSSSSRKDR